MILSHNLDQGNQKESAKARGKEQLQTLKGNPEKAYDGNQAFQSKNILLCPPNTTFTRQGSSYLEYISKQETKFFVLMEFIFKEKDNTHHKHYK